SIVLPLESVRVTSEYAIQDRHRPLLYLYLSAGSVMRWESLIPPLASVKAIVKTINLPTYSRRYSFASTVRKKFANRGTGRRKTSSICEVEIQMNFRRAISLVSL